jgi:hypothetical protein
MMGKHGVVSVVHYRDRRWGLYGQCNELTGSIKCGDFFGGLAEELSVSKEGFCSMGLVG